MTVLGAPKMGSLGIEALLGLSGVLTNPTTQQLDSIHAVSDVSISLLQSCRQGPSCRFQGPAPLPYFTYTSTVVTGDESQMQALLWPRGISLSALQGYAVFVLDIMSYRCPYARAGHAVVVIFQRHVIGQNPLSSSRNTNMPPPLQASI